MSVVCMREGKDIRDSHVSRRHARINERRKSIGMTYVCLATKGGKVVITVMSVCTFVCVTDCVPV